MENMVHDFDKMSLSEKITFLNDIFQRQRLLAEQNLGRQMQITFLNELNDVYAKNRDNILNELIGIKSDKDILNIILKYF